MLCVPVSGYVYSLSFVFSRGCDSTLGVRFVFSRGGYTRGVNVRDSEECVYVV